MFVVLFIWMVTCSGQRCTAVKVVCVMESVADDLVKRINEKIKKLTVGMPEKDCDITPVISETSANFIQGLVEDAKEKGAKLHQVQAHPETTLQNCWMCIQINKA